MGEKTKFDWYSSLEFPPEIPGSYVSTTIDHLQMPQAVGP